MKLILNGGSDANLVTSARQKLNEAEKFIIKSLEFDNPLETDKELIDGLMTYKNVYYLSKKSAYVKMAIQLNIKNVKKMESDDFFKNMLADTCIVAMGNNK